MTYFSDLSPYTYMNGTAPDGVVVLNVGWLDEEHPYTTGQVPEGFVERLNTLRVEHPRVKTRGFEICRFCQAAGEEIPKEEFIIGVNPAISNAEIRVLTQSGEVLAAPSMVYHYVVRHGYLPPEPFIEAVMALRVAPEYTVAPTRHA